MRFEKRLIALFLYVLMLVGTILPPVCSGNEVRAAETTGTEATTAKRILFKEKLMTGSMEKFPFSSSNYNCMTNYYQIVISAGYTNVISYCAPSDGFVRISDIQLYFHTDTDFTNAREFEFAITNEKGEILSNSGQVLTLNNAATLTPSSVQYETKKGEHIYFMFHGSKGYANLAMLKSKIEFSIDGSDDSWTTVNNTSAAAPWPVNVGASELTEQGQGSFYYQYSDTYMLTEWKKESGSKLVINPWQMEEDGSIYGSNYPFVYSAGNIGTSVGQIILQPGHTNVIAYEAPSDGIIWIENLYTFIRTPKTETLTHSVEFALIDEEGNILTNGGELYTMNSAEDWTDAQSAAENLTVSKQNIKQGERIYFVFHGLSGTASVRCDAEIQFYNYESKVTECVNAYNDSNTNVMSLCAPNSKDDTITQGMGNFYYEYSKVYEMVEEHEPEYLYINPTEMAAETTTRNDFPFMYAKNKCMTNYNQIIVSAGYTNIIACKVEDKGTLCIDEMKVWISGNNTDAYSEFAVVDKNGKIISNFGRKYDVYGDTSGDNAKSAAKNIFVPMIEMEEGECIYFVFHGVNIDTQSLRCNAKILFCEEGESTWMHVNGSDVYKSSDMTLYSKNNYISSTVNNDVTPTQGLAGFYYLYSKEDTTDMGKKGKTVGTDPEGIVTIYGTPAKGTTYCDKYITDVADNGTVSYIDLDMLNIKKQSKINEDKHTIDVRYIASVDSLSYEKVGFVFSLVNGEPTIGEEQCADRSFTKVYKRMLEDKGYRKAENLYAEDGCSTTYAFAFEMLETPAYCTVYARAYVELNNGDVVYGEPRAVTTTGTGTDFASLVKNGELNIADCGAIPNTTYDYGDLIRTAIHTCLDTGAKLVMEEGTYYCSPEENSEFLVDLSSESANDFTLEGNGAQIVNMDAFSGFFRFSKSNNISISGLKFDYLQLPWVQGEVVSYNKDTKEITLITDESHTIFDDQRYLNNVKDIFGVVRNNEDVRKIDVDRTHFFRISTVKKVEDKKYVVTLDSTMQFSPGDQVTINNRKNAAYSVFDIRTCGNVNLKDIDVYASAGCLVLGQYMTGDVILDDVNARFGNDNRWITTNADGVHIQASAGKLVMNNCLFEGLSDDSINLYQRATVIPEMDSNQTFILDGTATGTRVVQNVGETLIFYNPNSGETLGEAKVTNIEQIQGSSAFYQCKVTVDTPIEGIITSSELETSTNVFIKEKGHNGSKITNCTFRYIRAGGVCLRANDVTVQGNSFEHISGRAVNVAVWSSEGSAVDGVKILNNTVTDCAYHNDNANTFMAGSVSIYMLNYARTAQVPNAIHKNVVIKGNTINGWHGRAIWIANSKNVEIADNVFHGDDKLGMYDIKETIYINECEDVTVSGNKFHDNTSEYYGSIVYDSATVSGIEFWDNEFDIEEDRQIVKIPF